MSGIASRFAATVLAVALASPAAGQTGELDDLWRAGINRSDELFRHPALNPMLRQVLGARYAEFEAASAKPDALERFSGKVVLGRACRAEGCARGGVFVVADGQRNQVLVLLADSARPPSDRVARFATPDFPFPHERVYEIMLRWRAAYAEAAR